MQSPESSQYVTILTVCSEKVTLAKEAMADLDRTFPVPLALEGSSGVLVQTLSQALRESNLLSRICRLRRCTHAMIF